MFYDPIVTQCVSHRELLQRHGMGFAGIALSSLLNKQTIGGAKSPLPTHPLARREPHHPAPARSVIWLLLNGGPSQIDTWDYKPELQKRNGQSLDGADPKIGAFTTSGKLLASPFKFAQRGESGTWTSEIFPNIQRHVDEMAFIHSCYTQSNNHSPALFQINTGMNRMGFPCLGSWMLYGLGSENENLPGFVVMTDALGRGLPKGYAQNWGSGFLPGAYQGTQILKLSEPIANLSRPSGVSAGQQRQLLDAVQVLNRKHHARYRHEADLTARIESFELAFRMQMSAPEILDVEREPQYVQQQYGMDNKRCKHFAWQCLLARRMVEAGVRFIQIYSGGTENAASWDGHDDLEKNHRQFSGETDQPIAALLSDLKQRGLLDSTLVVCCGEFGRTSDSQGDKGRDHNPNAFTAWMAGGGAKGGVHYGRTDEFGYKVVENRAKVHDLHATILQLVGLNHERLTYRFNGRDFRLTDVEGEAIRDIIA